MNQISVELDGRDSEIESGTIQEVEAGNLTKREQTYYV
jgi:hypothetical protein